MKQKLTDNLIAACVGGDAEQALTALKAGADIYDARLDALLKHKSTKCAKMVNDWRDRHNDLMGNCYTGNLSLVKALLSEDIYVNQQYGDDDNPLVIACKQGHHAVVAELLTAKANINQANSRGVTPLRIACHEGHDNVITELLNAKANINHEANDATTPLLVACLKGNDATVMHLLAAKASVNHVNNNQVTPLFVACKKGHHAIVAELLATKANVNQVSDDGSTPLYLACQEGHKPIVTQLLTANATINHADNSGLTPLYFACQQGNNTIVKQLLDAGANANQAREKKITPLLIACLKGHDAVVTSLITAKANTNQEKSAGQTPLIVACIIGHDVIATKLLDAKANINQPLKDASTPLSTTYQDDQRAIVSQLLTTKVSINKTCVDGANPLLIACLKHHDTITTKLITAKANINQARGDGTTPLHIACKRGNNTIVTQMLTAKANFNDVSENGVTPLHNACAEGHEAVVAKLLAAGACVPPTLGNDKVLKAAKKTVCDSIWSACKNNDCKSMILLRRSKFFNVNMTNQSGDTLLMLACHKGHREMVTLLLDEQADIGYINVKAHDKRTPFSEACINNAYAVVELLLEHAICSRRTINLIAQSTSSQLYRHTRFFSCLAQSISNLSKSNPKSISKFLLLPFPANDKEGYRANQPLVLILGKHAQPETLKILFRNEVIRHYLSRFSNQTEKIEGLSLEITGKLSHLSKSIKFNESLCKAASQFKCDLQYLEKALAAQENKRACSQQRKKKESAIEQRLALELRNGSLNSNRTQIREAIAKLLRKIDLQQDKALRIAPREYFMASMKAMLEVESREILPKQKRKLIFFNAVRDSLHSICKAVLNYIPSLLPKFIVEHMGDGAAIRLSYLFEDKANGRFTRSKLSIFFNPLNDAPVIIKKTFESPAAERADSERKEKKLRALAAEAEKLATAQAEAEKQAKDQAAALKKQAAEQAAEYEKQLAEQKEKRLTDEQETEKHTFDIQDAFNSFMYNIRVYLIETGGEVRHEDITLQIAEDNILLPETILTAKNDELRLLLEMVSMRRIGLCADQTDQRNSELLMRLTNELLENNIKAGEEKRLREGRQRHQANLLIDRSSRDAKRDESIRLECSRLDILYNGAGNKDELERMLEAAKGMYVTKGSEPEWRRCCSYIRTWSEERWRTDETAPASGSIEWAKISHGKPGTNTSATGVTLIVSCVDGRVSLYLAGHHAQHSTGKTGTNSLYQLRTPMRTSYTIDVSTDGDKIARIIAETRTALKNRVDALTRLLSATSDADCANSSAELSASFTSF